MIEIPNTILRDTQRDNYFHVPTALIDHAKKVSLVERAEQLVRLHSESATEYAGPCPRCGGDDRFHCTDEWFMCRQCHDERGDVIEFVRWLNDVSFREAVSMLTGGASLPVESRRMQTNGQPAQANDWDETYWRKHVDDSQRLLNRNGRSAGRDYLHGRGIEAATWQAFGVGERLDTPLPHTGGAQTASAIVMPWYGSNGELNAVCYRFLQPHDYVNVRGEKIDGLKTASRGQRSGNVFGLQALHGHREALVLCEGEINAMSIWQVANKWADVLSVGSESQMRNLPGDVVAMAGDYGHVIVWADRPEIAAAGAKQIPNAQSFANERDANDWLCAGQLSALLTRLLRTKQQAPKLPQLFDELSEAWAFRESLSCTAWLHSFGNKWLVCRMSREEIEEVLNSAC